MGCSNSIKKSPSQQTETETNEDDEERQNEPLNVSKGQQESRSTFSTSSHFLNSLTNSPTVILPPLRSKHRSSSQHRLPLSSLDQGQITYRFDDDRRFEFDSKHTNKQVDLEEENRYDQSLVQRYLEKSNAICSRKVPKSGKTSTSKNQLVIGKSKLQIPSVGKYHHHQSKTKKVISSSTGSSSSSTSPLRKEPAFEKDNRTFSRLSVDSEKTLYNYRKKTTGAGVAGAMSQLQHKKSLSLQAFSTETIIEKVKSNARVPTPTVLEVRGYVFYRLVASGSYSQLFECRSYGIHNLELACKHIHSAEFTGDKAVLRLFLEEEMEILERVNHRNIIRMYEIVNTPTDVYIIMKFATNGTVFDYLYKVWKKPLPETYARRWMKHLMIGLEYLHNTLQIVHRDLKLENFLLDEKYTALLSDFGLAVQLGYPNAQRLLAVHCGTQDYMAPELNVTSGSRCHFIDPLPADIYAMGVSLFELLNSYRPFALSLSESSHSLLYRQQHRQYTLNRHVFLEHDCRQLLELLLEPKPSLRPKAIDVLAHPWFMGQMAT